MNKEALYNIAQHATRMSKQARDPNSLTYVPGLDSGNGTPRAISPYLPQRPKANPQQGTARNEPSWLDRFGNYMRTGAGFLFGTPTVPIYRAPRYTDASRAGAVFSAAGNNLPKNINRYIQRPRPTGTYMHELGHSLGSFRTGFANDAIGNNLPKNINRYIQQPGFGGGSSNGRGADR